MEAVDDLGIACCHHANEQYRFHWWEINSITLSGIQCLF
jgi:hypothetical protein